MQSAKGKLISWGIFVLVIIGTFLVLIYLQSQKQIEDPVTALPPAPIVVEIPEVPEPPKKPKKEFAIPELSDEEKREKDQASYSTALSTGKGCEGILDPNLKRTCSDTLNYSTALDESSEAACKKIIDEVLRTKCIDQVNMSLASTNNDAFFCENISDVVLKQTCSDRLQVAESRYTKNKEACDSIQTESLKEDCLDNFYLTSSIEALDEEGCSDIQDSELVERCQNTVVKNLEVIELSKKLAEAPKKTTEEILTGCDTMTGDSASLCKDEANFKLAFEKKDLVYCNAISDSNTQDRCIKTQSSAINNYYLRLATAKKDPDMCNKILDSNLRTTCLQSVQ